VSNPSVEKGYTDELEPGTQHDQWQTARKENAKTGELDLQIPIIDIANIMACKTRPMNITEKEAMSPSNRTEPI